MPGPYRTLFLDLDDTLYPHECGVWEAISARILGFMVERMSFTPERARTTRLEFVERYGTTLRGLMQHFDVDPREYMRFVHDVPIRRMIRTDPLLQQMLAELPQAKWVLTNADRAHAGRVLEALGVESQMDGVIDFFDLSPHSKPEQEAFQRALQIARAAAAAECVLVDDQTRNLVAAQGLGMLAVLVGKPGSEPAGSVTIDRITELSQRVPALGPNREAA